MAFNGSGIFSRIYNWVNDAAANIPITASRMDTEMDGMATGLSTCITKDGQTTITANLPMAGFRHTGVGNGVSRSDYFALGQAQDGKVNWVAAGGTADAITAAYSVPVTALVDGQLFWVRASGANTVTNPTFNPSALGALTIVKNGGQALAVGDIYGAGHELILRYRLSATRYELLNPAPPAASAADMILSAVQTVTGVKTFGTIGGAVGKLALAGSTSGSTILNAAAVAGSTTVVLPDTSGTLALNNQATDTFGALTDNTTNNVSSTAHGFCPKYPNNTTTFLRGDGTYAAPPTSSIDTQTFSANGTWTKPSGVSASSLTTFRIWDGGAAGASRTTTGNANGGAGGAYAEITVLTSALAATETMTVAASAAGVTGNTAGTNGNQSSVTINGVTYTISTTSARGGTTAASGGAAASVAGGVVNTMIAVGVNGGATGSIDAANSITAPTNTMQSAPAGGSSSSTAGGTRTGASGIFATGGTGGANTGGNGTAGSGYGAGGGGAVQGSTSGAGAAGRIEAITFK